MRLLRVRWNGLKVRGNSTEGQEARRFRGHEQHRQVTRCEREMQTCSNQCHRRKSWRICTTGAGFAQADQTYNVSPNAKEKSPVPHVIRKYLQRRRGFLMRISNLI